MRHELKYVITPAQYMLLRERLKPFLQRDEHTGTDGNYFIRSIYFDTRQYAAMNEKLTGINHRKKYRIRYYNGNAQNCNLECKIKEGTRIDKKSVSLSVAERDLLLLEDFDFPMEIRSELLMELMLLRKNEGYRAQVIVDYLREAYVYPVSNVRITFDKEIAAGTVENYEQKERGIANVLPWGNMVLEVKYDEYLPMHIGHILASVRPVQVSASKYTICMLQKLEGKII